MASFPITIIASVVYSTFNMWCTFSVYLYLFVVGRPRMLKGKKHKLGDIKCKIDGYCCKCPLTQ